MGAPNMRFLVSLGLCAPNMRFLVSLGLYLTHNDLRILGG